MCIQLGSFAQLLVHQGDDVTAKETNILINSKELEGKNLHCLQFLKRDSKVFIPHM
jgi:hypothetical protein